MSQSPYRAHFRVSKSGVSARSTRMGIASSHSVPKRPRAAASWSGGYRLCGCVKLDATCGIFGESELIGQILRGHPVERLCAGVNQTLVKRVMPMLQRFPGETLVLTGGVALNGALVKLLEKETGRAVIVPPHPQHNGAIGCAACKV